VKENDEIVIEVVTGEQPKKRGRKKKEDQPSV
jgi:hypothetical protein